MIVSLHGFQASEGRTFTGTESLTINVFDSDSSGESLAFMACVVALSVFVLVCLVGGGISFFRKRHVKSVKETGKLTTDAEKSTSQGKYLRLQQLRERDDITNILPGEAQDGKKNDTYKWIR